MARLIDADELIEAMCESCDSVACDGMGKDSTAKCYSIRLIEEAPTVDAVPVVRCQDCKHWEVHMANPTEYISWCELVGRTTKPYDFCSCGERRKNGRFD